MGGVRRWAGGGAWAIAGLGAIAAAAILPLALPHLPESVARRLGAHQQGLVVVLAAGGALLLVLAMAGRERRSNAAWWGRLGRSWLRAVSATPLVLRAAAIAACAIVARHYTFFSNDNSTYLAVFRRMIHPELYPGDPLFDTHLFHVTRLSLSSRFLAHAIELVGPDSAWLLFFLLYGALMILLWAAVLRLAAHLPGGDGAGGAAAALGLWAAALALTTEHVTTACRTYDNFLVTRLFATVSALWAIERLAAGRAVAAGALAGLSFWLHPPTGTTITLMAPLCLAIARRWRDVAAALLVTTAVAAPFLVELAMLLRAGDLPPADPLPGSGGLAHFGPAAWSRLDALPVFLLCAVVGAIRARREQLLDHPAVRALLAGVALGVAHLALYLLVAVVAPRLDGYMYFTVRGVFVIGWCGVLLGAWGTLPVLRDPAHPAWWRAVWGGTWIVLLTADLVLLPAIALAALSWRLVRQRPRSRWIEGGAVVLAVALLLRWLVLLADGAGIAPTYAPPDAPLAALQRWARAHTPHDAVLLAPPNRLAGRFLSERAHVFHYTDKNVEGQGRVFDAAYRARRDVLLAKPWSEFTRDELASIASRFGATHLVDDLARWPGSAPLHAAPPWGLYEVGALDSRE